MRQWVHSINTLAYVWQLNTALTAVIHKENDSIAVLMNNKLVIVSENLIPFQPALCISYCGWKYWPSIALTLCIITSSCLSACHDLKKIHLLHIHFFIHPTHTHTWRLYYLLETFSISFLFIKMSVNLNENNRNPCTRKKQQKRNKKFRWWVWQ